MYSNLKYSLLVVLTIIYSCSNESEIIDDSNNHTKLLSDSSVSFIKFQPNISHSFMQSADITNVTYSMESIYIADTLKYFMCKTKVQETGIITNSHGSRIEKIEFFDYNLIKQFEIDSKNRETELQSKYFITRSLITNTRMLELNNYETNEAFIKCNGTCWTVEIPNGETVAYFGYQSKPPSYEDKINHLGTFYFGMNETRVSEVRLFSESTQRYHSLVSFSLIPKHEQDKVNYSNSEIKNLTLWSQNGNSGKKSITGFDILLKLKREKIQDSNEYENIEYLINVQDGKLLGNELLQTPYGYKLILL